MSVYPEDGELSWDTEEVDENGSKRFENGVYVIEVTAHDTNGNQTIKQDSVFVKNN